MSEPHAAYVLSRAPRRLVGGGARGARKGAAKGNGQPQSAEEAGFPGCKAVPMTPEQLARPEEGPRFEYWDAEGGVLWMVEEGPTIIHEYPGHNLPALLERIADARGAPILCGGAMTFYERGPTGKLIRAMEADQTIYLDAARARALPAPTLVLGADAPPDVVLEVDHTTDVRRRKLAEYQRWRFPEVWVEVPEPWQGKRSRRRPGLTIHVLDPKTGCYGEAAVSKAFAGWRAAELHLALNEPTRSEATWNAMERVGCAMAAREGLPPTVAPNLRRQLAQGRSFGHREGRAEEGQRQGREDAQQEANVAAVLRILEHRGIACSRRSLTEAGLAACSLDAAIAAALACDSEEDFLARLGRARG